MHITSTDRTCTGTIRKNHQERQQQNKLRDSSAVSAARRTIEAADDEGIAPYLLVQTEQDGQTKANLRRHTELCQQLDNALLLYGALAG